jgi:glycerol-3-phosphate acyltransferase PlsX
MKIIVDAMGGDNAPAEIIRGALDAHAHLDTDIVLVGRMEDMRRCLEDMGVGDLPTGGELAAAAETIEMDEDPVSAVRTKRDSSMAVGLRLLHDGGGDAFVSAGSTGALLSGATLIAKRVRGIRRAALAPVIPGREGEGMIIDCGANAECTPEYLLQFAFMGSYYMENVMKLASPRVGLLNIGTEANKGTQLQTDTYALLEKAGADGHIRFVGNVEAKQVMLGGVDVIVCDGFSGNILLKGIEGVSRFFAAEIKDIFMRGKISKISGFMVRDAIYDLKDRMDPDKVGGTALLGIAKPVSRPTVPPTPWRWRMPFAMPCRMPRPMWPDAWRKTSKNCGSTAPAELS